MSSEPRNTPQAATSFDRDAPEERPGRGRMATVVAGAAGVVGLIALAGWLFDPLAERTLATPEASPALVQARDVLDALLGLGGIAVMLAILGSLPNGRRATAGFLVALIAQAVPLHLLKWAVGRARPRAGLGPYALRPFESFREYDSFPSGHAAATLLVAIVLGWYFPRYRWVFYGVALLVGLERVLNGWHYPSDVLAGYLLGGLVAWACYRALGPAYYRSGLADAGR